jgi:hypothetical protein
MCRLLRKINDCRGCLVRRIETHKRGYGWQLSSEIRLEILLKRNRWQVDLDCQESVEGVPQPCEVLLLGMLPRDNTQRNCPSGIRIKDFAAVARVLAKEFQYRTVARLKVLPTRHFDPGFLFCCEVHRVQNTRPMPRVNW